uniref:F-box domain-containing protein n=2 Tax=Lactuca sativa TaxID=4236 RepID=A0A9R1WNU1_LACSA|nr:hypothetical protein LSAT_V11C100032570 [Lactuca sativa]
MPEPHYLGLKLFVNLIIERHKKTEVIYGEEDKINNLPEHLTDLILEQLPIEDAAKTNIISKKWRHRWTKMRVLVFDDQFSKKFAKNGAFGRNGFIRIIIQVLTFHKGPILKFYLHMPNIVLDSFQEVDQFMLLLSRNGVTDLVLTNSNQRYKLPSHVYSCLQLRKLDLENCFFKPPLEFEGFLNLEELFFENIDFAARLCGAKVNLPQLKKLCPETCKKVYNFNIKAIKLWNLTVIACHDAMLLWLLDSPCLFDVVIALQKPIQNFVRVEEMNLATVLSSLPKVRKFCIDSHYLKFLSTEEIPKLLPCELGSLRHLWLLDFELGDLDQLHGALCLIRNSPNLESLHMHMLRVQEAQVDVGPASDHLESPNCLDCTLNHLETVDMEYLEGSRAELLFMKLLLAYSPFLEDITITPRGVLDALKILDIAKDVMLFPRASSKVKIMLLNPER